MVSTMRRLDSENSRTVGYSDTIEHLENYYNDRYELIRRGNTDFVTLDLVALGNALDFIHLVQQCFSVHLDNHPASVESFEEVLDALNRGIINENLFSQSGGEIAQKAAAYLGFLIIATIGGEWLDTEDGLAVNVNGRCVYVEDWIGKRLVSGSDLNVTDYYRSVQMIAEPKA